jgi:hypothetical protein
MASTRNNNTIGQYKLQQSSYAPGREYLVYKNGANGVAYNTRFAGNGLLQGHIPWNQMSRNSVDIEGFLFGVGSTNLVNPIGPLTPEIIPLNTANIYETPPVLIPEPLMVHKGQRPFPIG